MRKQRTAFGELKENMALAIGRDMSFSTKHAIEICNYLRYKRLKQAKDLLEKVIIKRKAIPFKRFTDGVGHKKGNITSGRYPIKASKDILKLLKQAESNASIKGLSTEDLTIRHLVANKASTPMRFGRHVRRKTKRTHIEVVVEEVAVKKKIKSKQEVKMQSSTKEEKKTIPRKDISKKKDKIVNKEEEKPAEK
jgi:large subunit ribosomal protein L22